MRNQLVPVWYRRLACLLILMTLSLVACGGDADDDNSDGASAHPSDTAQPSTSVASGGGGTAATGAERAIPTGLEGNLTVFAAASLTAAFEEMQDVLEEANPDLSIAFNFAGSQQLATQLIEGADADVFASANATQMTAARDAGTIAGEPVVFVRNRLAIIVPSDNPGGIQNPADLATEGLKIVVANEDVPVGGYTLEVLDLMSSAPAFGESFRSRVEANFVSLEDNVRQVVTKVQLGEADAGVVYVSDVTPDVREDVTIVEIPDDFNVIARYPVATVEGGDGDLAQAFIDFVLSAGGQAILEEWGFTPVGD